jgi:hypothetical protein
VCVDGAMLFSNSIFAPLVFIASAHGQSTSAPTKPGPIAGSFMHVKCVYLPAFEAICEMGGSGAGLYYYVL